MYKINYRVNRRTYNKPKLEQVKLIAEEAVLSSCKSPSAGVGPVKKNCKGTANEPCLAQTS